MTDIPAYHELMNPILVALHELGGSGTVSEIDAKASEIASLSDEQLEVLHNPNRGSQTAVEYRLAWARTYLKKYGLLENSSRGVWALTNEGREVTEVDTKDVRRHVRHLEKTISNEPSADDEETNPDDESAWQQEALEALLAMDPSAFERLVQRLLRESGFIQVEVTGKSGDGGIDGKGIMRLGGLLSFHVFFQCKRYQGSVSAGQVRDFRGAMAGRADKGLLVTTGNFTRDAIYEATRDGAQPIDLIDGELLVEKLKELGLGIRTEQVMVENVIVNHEWFQSI